MNKYYSLPQRQALATSLLVGLLVLLSIVVSYAIATYGYNTAIIILGSVVGFGLLVLCFAKPTYGFYLCILLAFVVPILERFLAGSTPLDFVVEILTYVTFLGQVYKKRVQGESFWKGMRHPINLFLLIYLSYLVLEFFNPNGSLGGALFSVRKTAQIVVLYITALSIFQSYKNIKSFLYFWIIASGVCGAYACYQQWVGFPQFELNWITASDVRIAIYRLDNGSFRKFSTLTDPAAFGILMAVSALLTTTMIVKAPVKRVKIWFSVLLIFQLLGMSFSGTRTAVFTVVAGLCLFVLMTLNNIKTLLFAIFSGLVFGFLLFAPIYGNITLNRFRSAFHYYNDASYAVRNNNRAHIQPYIHAHPIGGGPMTTGTNGLKYNPNHYLAGFPTDSGYLKIALEYGWIGLILACTLFFVILQQGAHAFYKEKEPLARALLLTAIVALFGNIVAQYSQIAIGASPEIYLFYALVAIIVNISKLQHPQKIHV